MSARRRSGDLTVIKLGGSVLDANGGGAVLAAVARARARGERLLLVHGGGAELSRWLERLGLKSRFLAGQRITTPEMVPAAVMVLGGLLNRGIVEGLVRRGCPAIGLTGADGSATTARRVRGGRLGAVGEITAVNTRLFHGLIDAGHVPVVASLTWGRRHGWLNVNADLMAAALAAGLRARRLFLLTDTPGVRGVDGTWMETLTLGGMQSLIRSGGATDGMIPKLQACRKALRAGVGEVRIASGLHRDGIGTRVLLHADTPVAR